MPAPGLREALAAVRRGDTLVVTKLDRLARSLRDAREIADELTAKGVALSLSMRTREGMAVARAKGRLKGKQPTPHRQRSVTPRVGRGSR